METTETNRAIKVGIFLALGILILVVGILTLGSFQKSFVKIIHLQAVFSDVNGLKKGNNIWFSGVKVGTISRIQFSGISKVLVQMNVEQSVQSYIHRNARVKISSDGLIGNKIIEIDGGSPNAPMVEDGDLLSVTNSLSTDDMMKTLQVNNDNLVTVTENLKKLTNRMEKGKGLVGALMSDTVMESQFKLVLKNLAKTTVESAQMAENVNQFSKDLNNKEGFAHKLLTDTVLLGNLNKTALQLNHTAAVANTLMESLDKASNQLNSNHGTLGVLLNDEKEAERMKKTLLNLNQSSIKLNDDLEAAQHNFFLRGFFKKREKAKLKKQDSVSLLGKNSG